MTKKSKHQTEGPSSSKSNSVQIENLKDCAVNVIDPIMLIPLNKHVFEFVRPNGAKVLYNLDSLVQYIVTTGEFREPETRCEFTDADLQRIDSLVRK